MIVCKNCGNQNPDNEVFCTSCRAFLEWSGEKVVEPPPQAPPQPKPPEPEPQVGFVEKVKQAVHLDAPKTETPPATASQPPAPRIQPQAAAQTAPPPASTVAASSAPAAVPAPSVSSVAQAPPAQVPAAQTPSAVLPQAAVLPGETRPPQAPKPRSPMQERIKPGDVICGQCGAGNSPERHFCQRCGANLAAAVVVKQPWWRRFFPARTTTTAGTRPSHAPTERAWGSAFFRVIALGVVALLVLAYLFVPPLHNKVNSTIASAYASAHRHFSPTYTYVRPSDATASSQVALHTARQSIDLIKETYWAANASTDKQPTLRITFSSPVDFDQILLTTGAGNDYATIGRPKDVSVVMSDKSTVHLTFKDTPDATGYDVTARGVSWVEIHILSVYATAQSPDVAINEVEFVRIQ